MQRSFRVLLAITTPLLLLALLSSPATATTPSYTPARVTSLVTHSSANTLFATWKDPSNNPNLSYEASMSPGDDHTIFDDNTSLAIYNVPTGNYYLTIVAVATIDFANQVTPVASKPLTALVKVKGSATLPTRVTTASPPFSPIPMPPSRLKATPLSSTSLSFSWIQSSPSPNVAGYNVCVTTSQKNLLKGLSSPNKCYNVQSVLNGSKVVTGLTPGTPYWFSVTTYTLLPSSVSRFSATSFSSGATTTLGKAAPEYSPTGTVRLTPAQQSELTALMPTLVGEYPIPAIYEMASYWATQPNTLYGCDAGVLLINLNNVALMNDVAPTAITWYNSVHTEPSIITNFAAQVTIGAIADAITDDAAPAVIQEAKELADGDIPAAIGTRIDQVIANYASKGLAAIVDGSPVATYINDLSADAAELTQNYGGIITSDIDATLHNNDCISYPGT